MLDVLIVKKLRDFTLDVTIQANPGEIVVLMGENGSGKSTTLNIIAGLMDPDAGYIRLNGGIICDPEQDIDIPAEDRRIGYLFQNSAAFPHLTVRDNIAFGLRAQHIKPAILEERVNRWLELMNIQDLARIKAGNLSGGQKQRVTLARALAIEPALLMVDEPFTALDIDSTKAVKELIKKFVSQMQIPCLVVSHRITDSRDIGDKACVLCSGKKEWEGNPKDLPEDLSVCRCA